MAAATIHSIQLSRAFNVPVIALYLIAIHVLIHTFGAHVFINFYQK